MSRINRLRLFVSSIYTPRGPLKVHTLSAEKSAKKETENSNQDQRHPSMLDNQLESPAP